METIGSTMPVTSTQISNGGRLQADVGPILAAKNAMGDNAAHSMATAAMGNLSATPLRAAKRNTGT
jgi:aspartokinase-like uncharacterized kinase